MTNIAKRELEIKKLNKSFKYIKAFDSTVITIASSLASGLYFESKLSGIKISTLLNLSQELPDKINIVPAKVNNRKCIDKFFTDKETLYLFDRGYYDYKLYDDLTDNGYKFIPRQNSNAVVEEIKSTYVENELVFDISAEEIMKLYRLRWKIELFFKWIKQNLKIKKWLGHNKNAIKIQIYSALISYIILALLKVKLKTNKSMLSISRIIELNLLEEASILNLLSG